MDYLGLFCLGAFVGAIVTYGLKFISGFGTFAQAVTLIMAAALSGTAILFVDKFAGSIVALGAYTVGLLVAQVWAFAAVAMENIKSDNPSLRLLGWVHVVGVITITLIAVALVLPPAFREMWGQ